MINYDSILSAFDGKPTLLQWLKMVKKALDESILKNVNITQNGEKVVFSFNFEDGTSIITPEVTLPIPKFIQGVSNFFIGAECGENTEESESDDNGRYNCAVGVRAMQKNISGDHITAIGFQALMKNTTGNANTALGEDALYENVEGSNNVAVGSHTLQNSKGSSNVAVGSGALINQTTGYFNTAIGTESGKSWGTNENSITSDYHMTFVGAYATKKVPQELSNSTAIGFGANVSKSNQVVLGDSNVTELVIGNMVLHFNEDRSVTWSERTD